LKLREDIEVIYRSFISAINEFEDSFFCLYTLLNTSVSQALIVGGFSSGADYLFAVEDIETEVVRLLNERKPIFLQEELEEMSARLRGEETESDVSDKSHIKIRGAYRPRSDIDPENYYKKALYGGLSRKRRNQALRIDSLVRAFHLFRPHGASELCKSSGLRFQSFARCASDQGV